MAMVSLVSGSIKVFYYQADHEQQSFAICEDV